MFFRGIEALEVHGRDIFWNYFKQPYESHHSRIRYQLQEYKKIRHRYQFIWTPIWETFSKIRQTQCNVDSKAPNKPQGTQYIKLSSVQARNESDIERVQASHEAVFQAAGLSQKRNYVHDIARPKEGNCARKW